MPVLLIMYLFGCDWVNDCHVFSKYQQVLTMETCQSIGKELVSQKKIVSFECQEKSK